MTFARRPRMNRRGIGVLIGSSGDDPPPDPSDPLAPITILSNGLHYYHGDVSVSQADAAGRARQWDDNIGAADWLQATAAVQPGYSATGLNNHGILSGNGTDRFMATTMTLASPRCVIAVMRQNGHANTTRLFGGDASTDFKIGGTTGSPNMNIANGGVSGDANAAAVLASWFRLVAYFNGADSFLQIGSTVAGPGVDVGANTSTAAGLFGISTGANYGAFSCGMLWVGSALPSAGQRATLDTWITDAASFGSSVGI